MPVLTGVQPRKQPGLVLQPACVLGVPHLHPDPSRSAHLSSPVPWAVLWHSFHLCSAVPHPLTWCVCILVQSSASASCAASSCCASSGASSSTTFQASCTSRATTTPMSLALVGLLPASATHEARMRAPILPCMLVMHDTNFLVPVPCHNRSAESGGRAAACTSGGAAGAGRRGMWQPQQRGCGAAQEVRHGSVASRRHDLELWCGGSAASWRRG